ncbi:nucleotide sugar dehydrogenase [Halorubrum ezzemoulense]|uniref:nucleotide sugar dehydrogenase n=1 Tax=Halorubrum ezzemoulense TaxID=337243 RepID=UPI00232C132E|nr:nucleotide sugar dehydrogenase [Halorubrum ezzemoulense]MDB9281710.1 nucleotide sugar dehydrogenase [Halorubrum ezzemoulense]MDB9285203.1 nucleotide sugar dehydrogenase [Halorubrum ezzemoulense]
MSAPNQIAVIGLGYVGLPLSLSFADNGYDVIGLDIDDTRIEKLQQGTSYIDDVSDSYLSEQTKNGLSFTTDYADIADVDGVLICVPTPLDKTLSPDVSYVTATSESLAEVLSTDVTVVLESTVYPGATEEIVVNTFEDRGFNVGNDVFIGYSPERIDPGNNDYTIEEIPKVVGGVTEECGVRVEALYSPVFDDLVPVDSSAEAEFVKLLENTFRTVNIALVNELATVASTLDIDIWGAIEAASTKPFGYMPFYPGPGLGGHCLPIDPLYLSWKAKEQGLDIEFIELANNVNRQMPEHVVSRVVNLLNNHGSAVPDTNVLIIGASYKADVADVRESPAFDVIGLLSERGANVQYTDPHVPNLTVDGCEYESIEIQKDSVDQFDVGIILTGHDSFDIDQILNTVDILFDTRNITQDLESDKIYRL